MMSMLEKGRLRLSVISVLKNIAVNIKKQKWGWCDVAC
jgi:hypothetical protein